MPNWMIIVEETFTPDEAVGTQQQATFVKTLSGNRTREEAQVELWRTAKSRTPETWKSSGRVIGRDIDGSFWVLPKNDRPKASCRLSLVEQI
ncbi:hypothetical protein ACFV7Q_29655 [Streptomyces sp. NPDC059851]|uniref:hypothetical protein n=1 Tax=Streptomyces sp. NPDC059851 TaxID=3346971 RepID=UPI0036484E5C